MPTAQLGSMAWKNLTCSQVDDTFGPWALHCRAGFDFTLLFEETLLTLAPLGLLLLFAPFRIAYLFKKEKKVIDSPLLHLKLVSRPSLCSTELRAKHSRRLHSQHSQFFTSSFLFSGLVLPPTSPRHQLPQMLSLAPVPLSSACCLTSSIFAPSNHPCYSTYISSSPFSLMLLEQERYG